MIDQIPDYVLISGSCTPSVRNPTISELLLLPPDLDASPFVIPVLESVDRFLLLNCIRNSVPPVDYSHREEVLSRV